MTLKAFRASIKQIVESIGRPTEAQSTTSQHRGAVTDYWTRHNVTVHHKFKSSEESFDYFHWRNAQYFNYINLMPVSGFDNKDVLDYGCGPGHDLVGFAEFANCNRLAGADVSPTSLAEAETRLQLHRKCVEICLLDEGDGFLPYPDESFDHIHCSGVLHHTPNPAAILAELRRVLRPRGTMNIMVYNYDSLWLHLYVAYQRSIVQGLYPELTIREQFARSTDGEECPIANCYRPSEWLKFCRDAGLEGEFSGAAISMHEASLCPKRFDAIRDQRLRKESRDFLLQLQMDRHGLPLYQGHYAGVDACFRLVKR
jgi:ubiquinone/menaquinone biosynthesis C-methylase UbiE